MTLLVTPRYPPVHQGLQGKIISKTALTVLYTCNISQMRSAFNYCNTYVILTSKRNMLCHNVRRVVYLTFWCLIYDKHPMPSCLHSWLPSGVLFAKYCHDCIQESSCLECDGSVNQVQLCIPALITVAELTIVKN